MVFDYSLLIPNCDADCIPTCSCCGRHRTEKKKLFLEVDDSTYGGCCSRILAEIELSLNSGASCAWSGSILDSSPCSDGGGFTLASASLVLRDPGITSLTHGEEAELQIEFYLGVLRKTTYVFRTYTCDLDDWDLEELVFHSTFGGQAYCNLIVDRVEDV